MSELVAWRAVEVPGKKGSNWVVEHASGFRQHNGLQYPDKETAERWAKMLNALHAAWGLAVSQSQTR